MVDASTHLTRAFELEPTYITYVKKCRPLKVMVKLKIFQFV